MLEWLNPLYSVSLIRRAKHVQNMTHIPIIYLPFLVDNNGQIKKHLLVVPMICLKLYSIPWHYHQPFIHVWKIRKMLNKSFPTKYHFFCRWMPRFWWLYIMFLLIKMRVNILITSWWDDWTSITNSCIQAIDSQPGVVFYTEVIRILWFRIRSLFVLVKPIHLLAVYLYVFL